METLILVIIVGLVTLGFVLLFRSEKKANQGKKEWFQKLGLRLNLTHQIKQTFVTKTNYLSGRFANIPVVIYEYPSGLAGRHQTIHTMIRFEPNPFDFEFSIGREGLSSKIGKAFGGRDIQFGDKIFDDNFNLKSNDEGRFRSLMDQRVQQELLNLEPNMAGFINSTGSGFEYNVAGPLTKAARREEYERVIEFMCALVKNQT